jgi:hypothetical protein
MTPSHLVKQATINEFRGTRQSYLHEYLNTVMPLQDYSPAELEPRNLTSDEITDPYSFIHELFSYAHLPQLREELWQWFKLTVTGSYHKEPQKDRGDFLQLYEKFEKLIEVVHILHLQNGKVAIQSMTST